MSSTATLVIFGGAFLGMLLIAPGRMAERLVGWAFNFVLWLVKLPFGFLAYTLKATATLIGIEVSRWVGVVVAGLMVYAIAWSTIRLYPVGWPGRPQVLLCVALLGMLWLYAVVRAAHYSAHNRLWKVRQQQMYRKISTTADAWALYARTAGANAVTRPFRGRPAADERYDDPDQPPPPPPQPTRDDYLADPDAVVVHGYRVA